MVSQLTIAKQANQRPLQRARAQMAQGNTEEDLLSAVWSRLAASLGASELKVTCPCSCLFLLA